MLNYYLAFDVGGTTIKYALIDSDLNIVQRHHLDTEHNHNGAIIQKLLLITRELQSQYSLLGIGVSTAGIVGQDGAIKYAGPTIPNYQGTPIKQSLEAQSGLPVSVVNDVDAALLGEMLAGAAVGTKNAYCIALGTGIGGAFAMNGKLYTGAHENANSIGYTSYHAKSDTYYEQRAATLALEHKLASDHISVKAAFEQAKAGIAPYPEIIQQWSDTVAAGIANVLLLLDPEVLVIGGAVALQGDYLVQLLTKSLQRLIPQGLLQTQIKAGALANDAQLIGAVANFFRK